MQRLRLAALGFVGTFVCAAAPSASAIDIVVDYTYDTNNFFDTQDKRDAMQAVADRFSRVITSPLAAVGPAGTATGTSPGWRIGLTHPGTGGSLQISTAASFGSDPIAGAGAATAYGFAGLNADEWTLFAGGRALSSAGIGGTGTGTNFTTTFDDIQGPMHRGFDDNTPSDSVSDLPRWGGGISFDTGRTWHFDLDTPAPIGELDFYSIALHEVGHALGLGSGWNQWASNGAETLYSGQNAIDVWNDQVSGAVTTLDLEGGDPHWEDGRYTSPIFAPGEPNLVGTVGTAPGVWQDLLMEPIANFTGTLRRFELTNMDVAALEDVGWAVLAASVALDGDANGDGSVDLLDFDVLAGNFGAGPGFGGGISGGDFNGDGNVDLLDFDILAGNFGASSPGSVPEPASVLLLTAGALVLGRRRRA
ncbi:MAG: dockerin type I domain-containing protein [Planctomycetota bacterium]